MKHLAKLLLAPALLLLAFIPSTFADVGSLDFGVTNTIAAATTNTTAGAAGVGSAVNVDNKDSVAVVLRFTGSGASTDSVTFVLARSGDGTNFETVRPISISAAANGTTEVVIYTNLNADAIGACSHLKCTSIAWPGTNSLTNFSITVPKKRLQ